MVSENPDFKPEEIPVEDGNVNLLPVLFCAIKTLGGVIGVTKPQLDTFPKDFGVRVDYDEKRKTFLFSCVQPRERGVLVPKANRNLILPN